MINHSYFLRIFVKNIRVLTFTHMHNYGGNQRSRHLPLQDANKSCCDSCDNFKYWAQTNHKVYACVSLN